MQVRINRHDVLQFLFNQSSFPRSVAYCVCNLDDYIGNLPNRIACEKQLSRLKRLLKKSSRQSFDNAELHAYIDNIQLQLANLHGLIGKTYFPAYD